jgi:hypothetical protein
LLCGGILFFQGWRQDPILQFGQFLLTGSAIFFAVESVRLRGAATEQARRSAPIVDEERPVSRVYRAELDDLNALEERSTTRRIRGSRDARPNRDEYEEGARRRPSSRSASDERDAGPGNTRRRRPRPEEDALGPQDYLLDDDDRTEPRSRNRSGTASRPSSPPPPGTSAKPRRPRPPEDAPRSRDRKPGSEDAPSEYVDYRPISNDDETDNWGDE